VGLGGGNQRGNADSFLQKKHISLHKKKAILHDCDRYLKRLYFGLPVRHRNGIGQMEKQIGGG